MMVRVGMHTYYGTPLKELHTSAERFETYAMLRELGDTIMTYTFPAYDNSSLLMQSDSYY